MSFGSYFHQLQTSRPLYRLTDHGNSAHCKADTRWLPAFSSMRYTLILLTAILFSCNSSDKSVTQTTKSTTKELGLYSRLLLLYQPVESDSLLVFSSEQLEDRSFPFHGRVIDSMTAKLFPNDILAQHLADYPSLFACNWFPMDSGKVGLVTRVPSIYVPSSIRLFILDTVKQTLTPSIELAEEVGDAGDMLVKKSMLIALRAATQQAIVWTKETHDHSVDEEVDTIPENWDSYSLISLHNNRQDTISLDSASLARRFEHFLKSRPAAKSSFQK